jgi:hypothetical protein
VNRRGHGGAQHPADEVSDGDLLAVVPAAPDPQSAGVIAAQETLAFAAQGIVSLLEREKAEDIVVG